MIYILFEYYSFSQITAFQTEVSMEKPSPTISETEIDMQKIQKKIKALELNLEKFSTRKLLPVHQVELETISKGSKESACLDYEREIKAKGCELTEINMIEVGETFNEEKVNDYVYYIVLVLCLSIMYVQDLTKIE